MPFIELYDFEPAPEVRAVATRRITDGLCSAFGIKPEIVTIYYLSTPHYSYGHAAKHGTSAEKFRIFAKVHAFPRDQAMKQQAACEITDAISAAYGASPDDVVVYFFDRSPADVFHAGKPAG